MIFRQAARSRSPMATDYQSSSTMLEVTKIAMNTFKTFSIDLQYNVF